MENFVFCAVKADSKEGATVKVNATIQGIIPIAKSVEKQDVLTCVTYKFYY